MRTALNDRLPRRLVALTGCLILIGLPLVMLARGLMVPAPPLRGTASAPSSAVSPAPPTPDLGPILDGQATIQAGQKDLKAMIRGSVPPTIRPQPTPMPWVPPTPTQGASSGLMRLGGP